MILLFPIWLKHSILVPTVVHLFLVSLLLLHFLEFCCMRFLHLFCWLHFFASWSAVSFPMLSWAFTQVKWIDQLFFSRLLTPSLICSTKCWWFLGFAVASKVILLSVCTAADLCSPCKCLKSRSFSKALTIASCSVWLLENSSASLYISWSEKWLSSKIPIPDPTSPELLLSSV